MNTVNAPGNIKDIFSFSCSIQIRPLQTRNRSCLELLNIGEENRFRTCGGRRLALVKFQRRDSSWFTCTLVIGTWETLHIPASWLDCLCSSRIERESTLLKIILSGGVTLERVPSTPMASRRHFDPWINIAILLASAETQNSVYSSLSKQDQLKQAR